MDDTRSSSLASDASNNLTDPINAICKDVASMLVSDHSVISSRTIYEGLRRQLECHRDRISGMDSPAIERLKRYLCRRFVEPCTRVGTIAAQSMMHGATQGQLSAFHRAGDMTSISGRYVDLQDLLDLRVGGCTCTFAPLDRSEAGIREAVRALSLVLLSDVQASSEIAEFQIPHWISIHGDRELIGIQHEGHGLMILRLDKRKMSEFGLTMRDVSACMAASGVSAKVYPSPNVHACLYVYYKNHEDLYKVGKYMSTVVVSSGGKVKNLRRTRDARGPVLVCPSEHLDEVTRWRGLDVSTLFCNDVQQVHKSMGICACYRLIYQSLVSHQDVQDGDALLVAGYMTYKGSPEPFVKQSVRGEYGPLFDMYYERPKQSLVEWMTSGSVDRLNNPYSRLMVGTQGADFSLSRSASGDF